MPPRKVARHPGGVTTDKTLRRDLERSLIAAGVKVIRQPRKPAVVVKIGER